MTNRYVTLFFLLLMDTTSRTVDSGFNTVMLSWNTKFDGARTHTIHLGTVDMEFLHAANSILCFSFYVRFAKSSLIKLGFALFTGRYNITLLVIKTTETSCYSSIRNTDSNSKRCVKGELSQYKTSQWEELSSTIMRILVM